MTNKAVKQDVQPDFVKLRKELMDNNTSTEPLTLGPKLFDAFQTRFKEWEASGFEGGDPELNELLGKLNQIDGLATIFSCASHPDKDDEDYSPEFSVMFAVRDGSFSKLTKLFQHLRCQNSDFNYQHNLELSTRQKLLPFGGFLSPKAKYNSWCIAYSPVLNVEIKQYVINAFLDVADLMLVEQRNNPTV